MRKTLNGLNRYIAGNAQDKRFLFVWCSADVCPSNLTNVFAFEDDYAMGVLTSSVHQAWAQAEASTLRVDLRYTPTSCFETFPWPDACEKQHEEIGGLVAQLIERRQEVCREQQIGLTDLYNLVNDGGYTDLAELHKQLDTAVATAYGWPASVAADPLEIRERLADLHRRILASEVEYAPFTL